MNISQIKAEFPIFRENPGLVYLDNAATTQKPAAVIRAVSEFYEKNNANIHRGVYGLAEKADQIYDEGRSALAGFVGASPNEVILTGNATAGANLLAFGIGESHVRPGDNVIITELEHHANYLPWQEMAKRRGAPVKIWPLDTQTMQLESGWLESNLDEKTRVIAITMMSNVLGYGTDLAPIIEHAHKNGTLVIVDAAQASPHQRVNFRDMGVDAAFFTGHKLYGPMGTGGVYLRKELADSIPPLFTGGGMIRDLPDDWFESPSKFEAGTPDVAGMAGLSQAIKFINSVGFEDIENHELMLADKMRSVLKSKPRIRLPGGDAAKTSESPIVAFEVEGIHPHDLASILADQNICVRAGHHCAKPLLNRLGIKALTRISFGVYNTDDDIYAVEKALEKAFQLFN